MFSPTHAALGASLAVIMPNPVLAFGAGLASHYVLDNIPHGDEYLGTWLRQKHVLFRIGMIEIVDLGLAIAITWWCVAQKPDLTVRILAGTIGAVLPDLTWGLRLVLESLHIRIPVVTGLLNRHQQFHEARHAHVKKAIPLWAGLLLQTVMVAVLLSTYR